MLRQLDTSLWVIEAPFKLLGIDFGNRMTCVQLADHSFWLHSPTRFNKASYEEIKAKGEIKYLVAPSLMHNLYIMDWKDQETSTRVLAPARAKKVQPDIKLDETPQQEINRLFNDEISCIPINGMPLLQEYAFIHHASKTLILTDLAFNFGSEVTSWTKFFLKLYGSYNKFGPTFTIRALIKDKIAFRESLQTIVKQNFDRIIVSHGRIVETDGKNILRKAFSKYFEQ